MRVELEDLHWKLIKYYQTFNNMLFNSLEFAIFLPIIFIVYWFLAYKNLKFQNLLLLSASYFFYAWWDWRFLSLIIFSSSIDYIVGLKLIESTNERKRKILLITSIFVNIGFLGFFKYFNFFHIRKEDPYPEVPNHSFSHY